MKNLKCNAFSVKINLIIQFTNLSTCKKTKGSASLNIKTNGKIALRTCSYFLITSLCNAAFGAFLAVTIHPGDASIKTALQDDVGELSLDFSDRKNTLLDNFLDLGRNIVPNNVFTSFFEMATTTYTAKVDAAGNEYFVKSLGSRSGLVCSSKNL